ncbi:MAG: type I pullulanase [Atopostipes suicloacalis]|nr:type I pullulanase [Atopostipes suicloacalis]
MTNNFNNYKERIKDLESKAYEGKDLGMTIINENYQFKVWSPHAKSVHLNLYQTADIDEDSLIIQLAMTLEDNVWTLVSENDLNGLFYTYEFNHGDYFTEAPDLYSRAVGMNGDRTAIIDLKDTHPKDWEKDQHVLQDHITNAIIWEVHIEDFSSDPASGIRPEYQGKYLAFTEENTSLYNAGKFPTGLSYLDYLGINYVHLLPVYDFDNYEDEAVYNWGYDPKNYNVPEGKYSLDPANPKSRIKELKQLIQSLHKKNIGVVMDVVYNHTYKTADSFFQFTVPDYYYRKDGYGNFSNGTGVGNETASERKMMRKFIIDSLIYWVEEYHIDGFRFDLMGVHDTETMNQIRKILDERGYEKVILYGEPWSGGQLALPSPYKPADQNHIHDFSKRIAVFNSQFRDSIKGDVFTGSSGAFLQGINSDHHSNFKTHDLIAAILANTQSNAGEYQLAEHKTWARVPTEVINYSSAHDNYTLYDKLILSTGQGKYKSPKEKIIALNKINAAILLTAQGGIFIHAGEEFARTKYNNPNSYNAPIAINRLDWARAKKYKGLVDFYRGMIQIRKAYPPLQDHTNTTADEIYFMRLPENVLAYSIPNVDDTNSAWKEIFIAINTSEKPESILLPVHDGQIQKWKILANINEASPNGIGVIQGDSIIVGPDELYILALKK